MFCSAFGHDKWLHSMVLAVFLPSVLFMVQFYLYVVFNFVWLTPGSHAVEAVDLVNSLRSQIGLIQQLDLVELQVEISNFI